MNTNFYSLWFDQIGNRTRVYRFSNRPPSTPPPIGRTTRCVWKVTGLCTLHEQLLTQRKKALLFMMWQRLMISKTKFQHSVTAAFFFARFSVKTLSVRPFCKNFTKLKIFGFFFFGAKDKRRTTNQPELSCPSWKNFNWCTNVASRSLWWWHDVKNSSFWVALEIQRGKGGGGRWSQEWEAEQVEMLSVWDKRCRAIPSHC